MKTRARIPPPPRPREEPTWAQLIAIARTTVHGVDDYAEWKPRLVEKLIALGFQVPPPTALYRAMDYNAHLLPPVHRPLPLTPEAHPAPTPAPPRSREALLGPQALTVLQEIARSTLTGTVCGCCKPVLGRPPLTCTREVGHDGDHGMGNGAVLFVRWARREGDR